MSDRREKFWSTLPEKVLHPVRVPIIEALWCIGEPLSPIGLVDVFDGYFSMWEALHHLRVLETLGVVDPAPHPTDEGMDLNVFDIRYRLKGQEPGDGS